MSALLEYRGYRASVEYDSEEGVYSGFVLDIPDTVRFSAPTIDELKDEMAARVDRYVDFCIEWGRPFTPAVGADFTVRYVA